MNPSLPVSVGQMPPPQPGQQQVIIYPQPTSNVKENYAALTSRVFGIIQITGGVFSIVAQAILIGLSSVAGYSGAGIWCGILYLIAGSFGYSAGKYKTKCLIITYMVLCIVASVFTIGIVSSSSVGLSTDKYTIKYSHDFYHYYGHEESFDYDRYKHYYNAAMAFNALLLLTSVLELVTLIWGSALTCKVMCSGQGQAQRGIVMMPVQNTNGQAIVWTGGQPQQTVAGQPGIQTVYVTSPPDYGYPGQAAMATVPQAPMEEKPTAPQTPPPSYRADDMPEVHP